MNISKELIEKIELLEAKTKSLGQFITRIPGAIFIRDKETNTIKCIAAQSEPDFDVYDSRPWDRFIGIDDSFLFKWSELENDPERLYLLELLNQGLTARDAWRKGRKEYRQSMNKKIPEPEPYQGKTLPEPRERPRKLQETKPVESIQETPQERMERIQAAIKRDFNAPGETTLWELDSIPF